MTPPARLWLVRHGQTDWNAQGRIQGHTPTELNSQGIRQAQELATFFSGLPRAFAACYSSDLPRAEQTAGIISAALRLTVRLDADLRERNFGPYEGHTSEQIRAARDALGLRQTADLADWTGVPGVESDEALWRRTDATLRRISGVHPGEDVLVVSHGGVIARALYPILGIRPGSPRRFPLSNGIVVVTHYRDGEPFLLSLADLSLLLTAGNLTDTATMSPPASKARTLPPGP